MTKSQFLDQQMARFKACYCNEEQCYRCAVGFVIKRLGLDPDCQCFSGRGKVCRNTCGRMFGDWQSALERCAAPYTEWAKRRLSSKGLVVDRALITDGEAEIDVTENVRRNELVLEGNGFFVGLVQNRSLAAQQLAAEVGTDQISYEAARLLVASFIRGGEPVPAPLRDWAADVILGEAKKPKAKGKLAGATHARDKLIFQVIHELTHSFGLKPSASSKEDGQSACHAVAQAFSLFGISPRSYEAVIRIWQNRNQLRGFDSRDD